MWMLAMFDLPTDTKAHRKASTQFRQALLSDGFQMLQYSVYGRPCPSPENAAVHEARIIAVLPEQGEVRLLMVTDQQFGRMRVFRGKTTALTEKPPTQITFF